MSDAQAEFLGALRTGCEHIGLRHVSVLIGVSGGADSVALLRGLALLRDTLHLSLHAAHLNHQLRGAESDRDAAWVSLLCLSLNVPCQIGSESIRDLPELGQLGLEGTARLARRRFLQRAAAEHGCTCIAVAHTANDQAETILHHILRGTGLAGLRGMHSQEITSAVDLSADTQRPLVRPMLQIERPLVERFLGELGQTYRTDSTNSDTTLTRNRIRHELLPLLERDFNPQIQSALLRLGRQAQDVYGHEADLAEALLDEALIETTPTHCRLHCGRFEGQPAHRVRESFVRLWHRLDWPRRQMGFADWDRLVQLVGPRPAAIVLPGQITARRREDLLMLTKEYSLRGHE